ncbi:hypothetical protein FRC01_009764 [Tulasnella sp. 417]|nr:hypothetical protein FRC01_009764 [Tulasnella sp. 417]
MQKPDQPLFFRGNGATKCEDFVNAVNRYAWKSGKSDDSKWTAHFAMSYLSGKALRWSMQLDNNVRSDWGFLSAALLLEYSKNVEDGEPEPRSPTIPTPAAAPPIELIRRMSALSLGSISGHIRVDSDRPSVRGYVSRDVNGLGILTTCPDRYNAIKVHWSPSSHPHLMRALNAPVSTYDYLGVAHFSNDPSHTRFGPGSTASAALTYTTKPDARGRVASMRRAKRTKKLVSGKSRAAIWSVLADSTIIPIVEESGYTEEPLFFRGKGATECEDFVNTVNRYAWKSGKSGDPEWAAHFAMSCWSGKALRWSMQLDRNTRKDWDLLSTALLLNYSEDVEDSESNLRSLAIPTPAAAPAPTTELIRGISALRLGSLTGRIRVDTEYLASGGYVSRNRNDFGILTACSSPEDAIKVHWTPSSSPYLMQILDPPVPKYNHLGVTHYSDNPVYSLFGPNSTASVLG